MQTNLFVLFKLLRNCSGVRSLSFARCNITNDTLNWLSNAAMGQCWMCPELEKLKIEECNAIQGFAFRQFSFNRWQGAENKWIVRFQELDIRRCSRVNQDDVKFCKVRVPKVEYYP